ncbi:MAG TPA: pyridoxamine 5'-phosphate oxidase family protein [Pseudonocardiaceae bacterium]|nr:pyridoxamine 5'-phosphate oxidase family protein [Pseudonocardiaceae bacterium]
MSDSLGLDVLDRDECLALLATSDLGRLVYTSQAMPAVQPVRFVLSGDSVLCRVPARSALFAGVFDSVVAFTVDSFAPGLASGWFVTVVGRASYVPDDDLSGPSPSWWVPTQNERAIRIPIESISGRRIPVTHRCVIR